LRGNRLGARLWGGMGHWELTFVAAMLVYSALARIIYMRLLHSSTSTIAQVTDMYNCSDFEAQLQAEAQVPLSNPYGPVLEVRAELPEG
jgi:hypothetical protein